MKRILLPILLIVTFWANATAENHLQSKSETMQKQDKEAIETLLMTYKGSLNTSDPKLAASLYSKDGIFMPTEAPSAIGTENILQSYTFIFSQIQLNIEFFIDEIVVEGDLAFATTSSKGTVLIKEANITLEEANRELFVFEKIGEEWKIARYMFNKTTPKAN